MSRREPVAPVVRLALAIGALDLTLLMISLLFMWVNAGVVGWYTVAWGTGVLAMTLSGLLTWPLGIVLASRRPGNPIGWILLLSGLWSSVFLVINGYAVWATAVRPGAFGGTAAEWAFNWSWVQLAVIFTFTFLYFPDGQLVSPRWRPVAWGAACLAVAWMVVAWFSNASYFDVITGRPKRNPLSSEASDAVIEVVEPLVELGVLVVIALSVFSLLMRFRRGSVQVRAQIKWIGLSGFAAGVCLARGLSTEWTNTYTIISVFVFSLIPLSMVVAILRHQLFDIDRIVSRTVSYAAVSVVVVATYALVVTSASRLLPDSGALPVAGATLAAAAVFLPVLRWVRDRVDRRFDRARFDAQQQVEAFAGRMGSTTDVDGVAADLQAVVQRTLAPAEVGVWVVGRDVVAEDALRQSRRV